MKNITIDGQMENTIYDKNISCFIERTSTHDIRQQNNH